MALKRKLQQEMDKNKKLEKDLEQKELDIDILKKASVISHIDEKIRTVDKYTLVKTLFNEFNVSKSRIINLIGIKKSSYYY